MVINHISYFVLTDTLLPLMTLTALEPGADVRIVNVTSPVHARVKPEPFSTREVFNKDYGTFAVQRMDTLQTRLTAQAIPITCLAAHPGAIKTTGSGRFMASIPYVGWLLKQYIGPFVFAPWRNGAMTVAFAAAGKDVVAQREGYRGAYMVPIAALASPSKFALDERLQNELYKSTQRFIKGMGL
ncbi:hypothetical protein FB451DRAFT_1358873 [Mycena latifolia]|nr:hypothetical protein FB451DRAFT_1358873 [Mycena latifolia]